MTDVSNPPGDLRQSLALSVASLLAAQGAPRRYDELTATLGLGSAMTAEPGTCPARWFRLGRDIALVEAARHYGLRLRELHPRSAAAHLETSSEFPIHFRDSYIPLMTRALAAGQSLLAWRGWGAAHADAWGVVLRESSGRIFGLVLGRDAAEIELTGAAHQVYVVEEYAPPSPEALLPAALLARAQRSARLFERDPDGAVEGLLIGRAAWNAWSDALRERTSECICGADAPRCHARLAEGLRHARGELARWFDRIAPAISGEADDALRRWRDACDETARALVALESREPSAGPPRDWRQRESVADALRAAGEAEYRALQPTGAVAA